MQENLEGEVEYVDFITCSGYKDPYGNLIGGEHQYNNGRKYPKNDHGICPECKAAHDKLFEEYKRRIKNGK